MLWKEVLILLLAILFCVASFAYSLFVKDPQWFERSGSIMVLLGAVSEFLQHSKSENDRRNKPLINMKLNEPWPGVQTTFERRLAITGIFVIIVGTIIWGYGTPFLSLAFGICPK